MRQKSDKAIMVRGIACMALFILVFILAAIEFKKNVTVATRTEYAYEDYELYVSGSDVPYGVYSLLKYGVSIDNGHGTNRYDIEDGGYIYVGNNGVLKLLDADGSMVMSTSQFELYRVRKIPE